MGFPLRAERARAEVALPPLIWPLFALACLPVAAVVGMGSARALSLLIMGVGGIAIFALAAFHPTAAIAGLLVAAGYVRVQLSTGTESALVASLLAALAITGGWIVSMVFRRNLHLVRSPVTFPLVAFATVNVMSFVWSRATIDPRITVPPTFVRVQTASLMVTVLSVTTLLIVGGTLRDRRWIATYLGILFSIGVLHEALLLTHGPELLADGRGLVPMWCISLAAAQAVSNTRLKWWGHVGFGIVSAFCLYALLVHKDWISGWLPAVISLFVVLLLRSRASAVITTIVSIVLIFALWGVIYDIFTVDKVQQGTLGGNTKRTSLWDRTLSTITPSPWLGSGPVGYALALVEFYPNDALSAHSNYIDVLAQSGVIGLAFFIWFLAATLVIGWRTQRRLRARGDPFKAALALGVLGGTVGMIVAMALGDWVIPFVYNQTIVGFEYTIESWICIGMLVALDAMSRTAPAEVT